MRARGITLCAAALLLWPASNLAAPAAQPDPVLTRPPASESNVSTGSSATPQDAVLADKVRGSLAADEQLRNSDISVSVNSGVVTLDGHASSADARSEATVVSETVEGVRSVTNLLEVSPTAAAVGAQIDRAKAQTEARGSDLWLTAKVKAALLADSPVYGGALSVSSHNGIIALSGTLDDPRAIPHLKDVVGRVDGVRGVDTSALEGGAQ